MVGLQSGGRGGWNPVFHGQLLSMGLIPPLHSLVHEKNYIGGIALKGGLGGGLVKKRV